MVDFHYPWDNPPDHFQLCNIRRVFQRNPHSNIKKSSIEVLEKFSKELVEVPTNVGHLWKIFFKEILGNFYWKSPRGHV